MLGSLDRIVRGSGCALVLMGAVALGAVAPAYAASFACTVGHLQGSTEVPPNASTATGTIGLTLDTTANTVDFVLVVSNLTSSVTAAHIHQAAVGVAGPVKVPLPLGGVSGTSFAISGTTVPVAGFSVTDIAAAPTHFYVNVHSTIFPGGEIRGQVSACEDVTGSGGGGGGGGGTGTGTGGGATPELDSILLFGSGLAGIGGYALMRLRAGRRSTAAQDAE
jgi:hypothetical protein